MAKQPTTTVSLVLQELRQATAEQHRSLERRLPFTSSRLDHSLYLRLIQTYYGFYAPLEHSLRAVHGGDSIFSSDRVKLSALRSDLAALGMTQDEIEALPLCSELPSIDNQTQLLGVMYVIEGATLGGQILRRIALDKLSMGADAGAAFLDVYGSDTGRQWRAYLNRLAQVIDPAERVQVVAAAVAIFTSFERWLEQSEVLQ